MDELTRSLNIGFENAEATKGLYKDHERRFLEGSKCVYPLVSHST